MTSADQQDTVTAPPADSPAVPSTFGSPGLTRLFAGLDLGLGALLLFGVWRALPARWWPVDTLGTLLAIVLIAASGLLVAGHPLAAKIARVAAGATLVVGAGTVTLLAAAAGHLVGLYGAVGGGGAIILGIVFLLLVPYVVVFPAVQLRLLLRAANADSKR